MIWVKGLLAALCSPVALCLPAVLCLLVALGAGGCGGGQTRGRPLDDSARYDSAEQVRTFLDGTKPAASKPRVGCAVGVSDQHTLVGMDLATGKRWRVERPLESRPAVAGEMVIGMGGGTLFGLRADDGALMWERPAQGQLRGASDDGDMTLVSIASLSGRHTTLLAINRSGRVVRQLRAEGALGVPALLDGVAFIPMRRKVVLMLDLVDGQAHARFAAGAPVSHALVVGRSVYMAEQQALQLDGSQAEALASGGGHWVTLPSRPELPSAQWLPPSTITLPPIASSHDLARLYVGLREKPAGLLHLTQVQGPLAVGLAPENAATRWVATTESAFIGGSTSREAVTLCDGSGLIRWLDPLSGAELGRRNLGEALLGCVVDSQRPPPKAKRRPAPALHRQLATALQHRSSYALPMQLALLEDLAQLPGAAAARVLHQLTRVPAQATQQRQRLAAAANEWQTQRSQMAPDANARRKNAPTSGARH